MLSLAATAMKRVILVIGGFGLAWPAFAATIVAAPGGPKDAGAIVVSGTLRRGDDEIFAKRLMQFPKGVVVLQGDGGDLQAGINIGTAIRLKNYATLVPPDSTCASACAIAWLGGAPRLMEDGSKIGFHAAYELKNGQTTEAGAPNALLGSYLGKIGLPDRAVVYIASAPPDGMTWLSAAEAEKMGIDVKTIAQRPAPVLADASPNAPSATEPSGNHSAKARQKKPKTSHLERKDNRQFVAWMMTTLRRLGASQSSSFSARDNALRTR
jgi:hypothetical protein